METIDRNEIETNKKAHVKQTDEEEGGKKPTDFYIYSNGSARFDDGIPNEMHILYSKYHIKMGIWEYQRYLFVCTREYSTKLVQLKNQKKTECRNSQLKRIAQRTQFRLKSVEKCLNANMCAFFASFLLRDHLYHHFRFVCIGNRAPSVKIINDPIYCVYIRIHMYPSSMYQNLDITVVSLFLWCMLLPTHKMPMDMFGRCVVAFASIPSNSLFWFFSFSFFVSLPILQRSFWSKTEKLCIWL